MNSPSIVVVNLDYSNQKGSHWIVLHQVEDQIVEHFDSSGNKPKREISNLLLINKMVYRYNNKRLQNYKTETCGLYCLYYSYFSCRERNMQSILSDFHENLECNEEMVIKFYLENFCNPNVSE